MDAGTAAPGVNVPVLAIAADKDWTLGGAASNVPGLSALFPSRDRHLEMVPGMSHGVELLDATSDPSASHVRALIEAFLLAHGSGS